MQVLAVKALKLLPMKEEYKLLHRQMINEIVRSMQLEIPLEERAESCFWIASNYWDKLKEIMKDKTFKDDSEEVDFFRNVKPRFTCQIEYFAILCEALQFVPKEPKAALHFWEQESNRFFRFCNKNETFVTYYESGEQCGNSIYFLRENKQTNAAVIMVPYDADEDLCSSHDRVLRSYLAHKMYNEYVRGRIKLLVN
jgi:hypothetical protein